MVLLHGIGVDRRVWQGISRRLSPHFHLYMLDLRGHGASGKPKSGYGLADYAGDVEQFLEALDLRDVTIVGSSLGGMVVAAIEAPASVVARRVLVDPPLVRGSGRLRPLFLDLLDIKQSGLSGAEEHLAILAALHGHHQNGGGRYLGYLAETWARTAPGVLRDALNPSESQVGIEAALAAIDVPTLIMRGNQELGAVLTKEHARTAVNLLRRGEELYFPKSGHAIHGSQPAEFVGAILDFAEHTQPARA
jgi:non-heme chloroperoxidase